MRSREPGDRINAIALAPAVCCVAYRPRVRTSKSISFAARAVNDDDDREPRANGRTGDHRMLGRKQQRFFPNRASAEQKHRACQRLLGCAILLALSLTLPVILTLRGMGSPGSTNDLDTKNRINEPSLQQSTDMAGEVMGEVQGWDGVMKGIPSMPRSDVDIHVVFSTDCSPYQNYQSILLLHSAEVCKTRRLWPCRVYACMCRNGFPGALKRCHRQFVQLRPSLLYSR